LLLFSCPAISCLAFALSGILAIRRFHVLYLQSTRIARSKNTYRLQYNNISCLLGHKQSYVTQSPRYRCPSSCRVTYDILAPALKTAAMQLIRYRRYTRWSKKEVIALQMVSLSIVERFSKKISLLES